MEQRNCLVLLFLIFTGVQTRFTRSNRGKAADLDISFQKEGDCPTSDLVSTFGNGICGKECYLDIDCGGREKCCQNECGGTQCQLPSQYVDRCEGFVCNGQGETCEVLDGQPSCVCLSDCADETESVCGDDGQVYSSRCWLDVAACELRTTINTIPCIEPRYPQLIEEDVPSMMISSTIFTADEYQDLTLYCDATSQSTVSYAWIVTQHDVNMKVLLPGNALDNIRVSFDGKVLFITSIALEDAGNFGCLASNLNGLSTVTHRLVVNAQQNPTTLLTNEQTTPPPHNNDGDEEEMRSNIDPPVQVPPSEVCTEALDRGHCFRQELQWFYNLQSERCEPFMYGGCGGNGNRFRTYEHCSQTCPNLPIDRCRHPIVTGHCRARFMRWAYREDTGECIEFVYGGCRANGNNFRTREECGLICQDRAARKEECLCVRPKLKSSYCKNDFVISGRIRQEIPSSGNGPLLVVEIDTVFKVPESMTIRLTDRTSNITMLRDMSRSQGGCQCISFSLDDSFIFMGRMSEYDEAIIDDTSYVSPSNSKRRSKLTTLTRCPSDHDRNVNDDIESDRPEHTPRKHEESILFERQITNSNTYFRPAHASPVYQRKPKRKTRTRNRMRI